jgi:hypothetical protein
LEGTCDGAGDEFAYYRNDITNISSDTYTKYLIRYKTSEASSGLGAKVVLNFTAGNQTILSTSFSTTWTTASGDITAGTTIDSIDIYADDNPDTVASGTYQVYYDFILLYKNNFSMPHIHREHLMLPETGVNIKIPGRTGNVFQHLGADSPRIVLESDMDNWETWGSSPAYGQYFYEFWMLSYTDLWQWYTSDLINCKVCNPRIEIFKDRGLRTQRGWRMTMDLYSLIGGQESVWGTALEWLGL